MHIVNQNESALTVSHAQYAVDSSAGIVYENHAAALYKQKLKFKNILSIIFVFVRVNKFSYLLL